MEDVAAESTGRSWPETEAFERYWP